MRHWRRPLILIALLLLAGAVVNVTVAWGIVLRMRYPATETKSGAPPAIHLPPDPRTDGHQFRSAYWESARWRPLEAAPGGWWVVEETHSYAPKVSYMRYHPSASRGTTVAGWPFLALRISYDIGPFRQRTAVSGRAGGVAAPFRIDTRTRLRSTGGRLPIDPLVRGFLLNTLFYSIVGLPILALSLSVVPIRRHLRARRGKCPKCGYDRVGLVDRGAAAPCPECGATR